jgi:hypothetical protein
MALYTTLRTIVNKRYRFTDTISVLAETAIDLRGVIYYDGVQDRVALDINNDKSVPTTLKDFFISVRSSVQSDWSTETYIGVRFSNARDSRITFNAVIGFTINVQCRGFGRGFVYNEVHLGSIGNGKYQLDLRSDEDDGDVGYVNENNFYKGHFFCGSAVNNSLSRYGARIRTNTTYINNNNRFYGPSFELFGTLVTGGAECVPIILRNCANNYFHEIRSEQSTSDGVVVRTSEAECKRNFVSMGFIAGSDLSQSVIYPIDNQSPGYGCYFENKFNQVVKPQLSYNLFQDCTPYNATENGFRNGLFILRSDGITYRSQTGFGIDEASGLVSVSSSRAVGIRVRLPTARTLSILRQSLPSDPGRILIRCLNSAQTPLDDSGGDLVRHSGATTFTFTTSWGNAWTIGSDSEAQYDMLFDESVQFVDVMVIGGTTDGKYLGFSVSSDTGYFDAVNVYGERTDDRMVAIQAPNLLAWKQGDRIYNHASASGGFEGWIATADIADASVDNSAFKQFGSIA